MGGGHQDGAGRKTERGRKDKRRKKGSGEGSLVISLSLMALNNKVTRIQDDPSDLPLLLATSLYHPSPLMHWG